MAENDLSKSRGDGNENMESRRVVNGTNDEAIVVDPNLEKYQSGNAVNGGPSFEGVVRAHL